MLIADGALNSSLYLWQESVSGLSVGSQYQFSGWLTCAATFDSAPAVLQIVINGVQVGTVTSPSSGGSWLQFSFTWTATTTAATIQIYDLTTAWGGNDFCVDDLWFAPVGPPPVISSVSPSSLVGQALPNRVALTLTGSNFLSGLSVYLTWTGGAATLSSANVTVLNSNQVYITPATDVTPDNWTVQVINPGGSASNIGTFQIVPLANPGDRIQCTQNGVNVRAAPGTSSSVIGAVNSGQQGTVVSGPYSASGYGWYDVLWDTGLTGYSAQDFLTKISGAPAAPSNLEVQAFSNRAELGWVVNSINETGFIIERSSASGLWAQIAVVAATSGNAAYYTDYTTTPHTTYTYRVRAYNAAGDSVASNEVMITTPTGAPGAFTLSNGTPVWDPTIPGPKVQLAWSPSTDAGAYSVYRNGQVYQAGLSGTTYTDSTGLVAGAAYTYYIQASNADGTTNSNTVTITMPAAPTPQPAISGVSPNPVSGSSSRQSFIINGSNFTADCTVTLRDLTTGEIFPGRTIISQTTTSITLDPIFGSSSSLWSVEVINPAGLTSGQYQFSVTAVSLLSGLTVTGADFGSWPVGSTTDQSITVTNGGNATAVGTVSLNGPFSIVGTNTYNIAPGQSQTFTVCFAPSAAGAFTGYVTLSGGGGYTAQLAGTAFVDPTSTFGIITGRVVDQSTGLPVDGVRVATMTGCMDTTALSPATGQDGVYLITGVATGYYILSFTRQGNAYDYQEVPQVLVTAGQVTHVPDTQLVPAPTFDSTADLPQNIPVVLVRGRGAPSSPDTTWLTVKEEFMLASPTFTNVWDPNETKTILDGTQGIEWNYQQLIQYIGTQVAAYEAQPANTNHNPPPHISFVAHSMGGLIVRRALNNRDYITCSVNGAKHQIPVKRVVMLGTPNDGTPLADAAERNLYMSVVPGLGFGNAVVAMYVHADWQSTADLTTDNILNHFNASYAWPSDVPCFRLAGTGGPSSGDDGLSFGSWLIQHNVQGIAAEMVNDGAVTRPSVSGQYYTSQTDYIQSPYWKVGDQFDAEDVQAVGYATDHYGLTSDYHIQNWVVSILQNGVMPSPVNTNLAQFANTGPLDSSAPLPTSQFDEQSGNLNQSATATLQLACDASTTFTITLITGAAGVNFTLRDPQGNIINSSSPQTNSNITFTQVTDPTSGVTSSAYSIANPAHGIWTITVDGSALTQSNAGYLLSAYGDSPVTLRPGTASSFHSGRDAVITCTLQDTSVSPPNPVIGSSVTAQIIYPDGTVSTQLLRDDGLSGDGAANDGTYAVVLANPTQQGTYYVNYRVSGTNSTNLPYTRFATGVFNVSADDAAISGNFSSKPVAAAGAQTPASLLVNCWVTAAVSGTYRLTGQLVDTSGTLVIPASVEMAAVSPGTTSPTLDFDLTTFLQAGFVGTATLANVQLFEETSTGLQWLDTYPGTFSVNIGPHLTASPQNTSSEEGTGAAFSVTADSGNITYQWLFNGTPIVGATNATYTLANVSQAQAGAYTVVVTNETGAVTTQPGTLAVTPATTFAHWQLARFTSAELTNPAISGDTADPANDNVPNLLKYAFNLDPFRSAASALPVVGALTQGGSQYLTLTYTSLPARSDITCTVQVSSDLRNWYSGPAYTSQVSSTPNPDGISNSVVVRALVPRSSAPQGFMRLLVTGP